MAVEMEKRIVFEPRDILKVRIQCGLCGGEFSPPSNNALSIPTGKCPLCGEEWGNLPKEYHAADEYAAEQLRLLNLLDGLRHFSARSDYGRRRAEGKVPWRILLELPGDLD